MQDLRLEFTRADTTCNWRTEYRGDRASLCDEGVQHYVSIPSDCLRFHAIASSSMPFTDYFNLIKPEGYGCARLELADSISWLGRALNLMDTLYGEGYRYIRVEY